MAGPVATVWAQFKLDMSDFSSKLASAAKDIRKFANFQQRMVRDTNPGYASATAMIRTFNRSLSDTANITRGIVISQAFYAGVGAIRDATNALWDFNKQLDYAHVTYSALFGDANLARDFMSVLQEHAIETIFGYQDLAGISKKLLAYGLEYENMMFIMEGLTNLGTMSGDSAALDRIALALGQIYTKGKLSAEEMRQLANAYVPITDIIQQKFGLTGDDLKRVGDLNLPAADVINAIVDYANENFGSVGDAAMLTITGLEAKIVDTLKVVGSEMIAPLTAAYKSFLAYVSRGLENIREAFNSGGIGGIFEYLVPNEDTQKTIRIFLANIKNLFSSIMSLGAAAGKVLGNFAQVFVTVFNAVVPAITAVTNALATVINAMASTTAGAATLRIALVAVAAGFIAMRIQAISALAITAVTKAVVGLSKALLVLATIIARHPIIAILGALGVALVGVTAASSKANSSLSGLFDTLAGTGGASSKDVLQKTEKDLTNTNGALDQFNNRLEEGKQNADDLADSIGGAGSAAKKTAGLLSFDEVFKLNTPSESGGGGGSGLAGALEGLEDVLGGIGGIGDALIPEIPDFSDYISDFTDGLLGGLSDGLKEKIAAGGWGALIGGILGALIGGAFGQPILGAKIGMAAGTLAGVLFAEFEGAVSNAGAGGIAGVAAAIAKGMAASFTDVVRVLVSAGSIDEFFRMLADMFKQVGGKAILKGGVIGIVIGFLVDGIAHLLWSWLDEKIASADKDSAKIGQTIGSILGTVIGGIFGGPAGMLIGSAIGTFVGGFVGLFWEPIKEFFADLGNAIGGWLSEVLMPVGVWLAETGAGIANWCTETLNGITGWAKATWASLSAWFTNTITGFTTWWTNTTQGLRDWWTNTVNTFSNWDTLTSETFGIWWKETSKGFTDWIRNTFGGLKTWWTDTTKGLHEWETDTKLSILNWIDETGKSIINWVWDTLKSIDDWKNNIIKSINQFAAEALKSIIQWAIDTAIKIGAWVAETWNEFVQWSREVDKTITGLFISIGLALDAWATNTWNAISTWVTNTWNDFITWATNVGTVLTNFFTSALTNTSTWLSNTWTSMHNWFADTKAKVKASWELLWDPNTWKAGWLHVSGWFNSVLTSVRTWFTTTKASVKTLWESLFDSTKWKSGWDLIKSWFSNLLSGISTWFSGLKTSVSSWWDGLFDGKGISVNAGVNTSGGSRLSLGGHYSGGIFNREHIARFAEGNKAEMVVPLENNSAMQPFVDAISNGIVSSLAPITASVGSSNNLPPLYVGTLIADDRGIRELYKKFEIIQVQENARRGITVEAF